jgi:hypothetical protein
MGAAYNSLGSSYDFILRQFCRENKAAQAVSSNVHSLCGVRMLLQKTLMKWVRKDIYSWERLFLFLFLFLLPNFLVWFSHTLKSALEEYFLMVPLIFGFNHFWGKNAFSGFFSNKSQSLKSKATLQRLISNSFSNSIIRSLTETNPLHLQP